MYKGFCLAILHRNHVPTLTEQLGESLVVVGVDGDDFGGRGQIKRVCNVWGG
jgi:hypothetical protein